MRGAALAEPRWFAVMSLPRQEATAAQNLSRQGYWTFYPHIRERICNRLPGGRRRGITTVEAPLFPRYLFVALRYEHESQGVVNDTNGVSGLVRFGGEAVEIPHPVMEAIMDWADADGLVPSAKPPHWFRGKEGDKVRMKDEAPFFGLLTSIASIERLDTHDEIRIWYSLLGVEQALAVPASTVAELIREDRAADRSDRDEPRRVAIGLSA